MNKKYKVFAKLVFLIFIILIIAGIVLDINKAKASSLEEGTTTLGIIKPVKIIDTPITIQGNQFWDSSFDYQIKAKVEIFASSSLSIGNGAKIYISNNAYFDVNGGVLNIGSVASTSPLPTLDNLLLGINSISNLAGASAVDLSLADSIFDSTAYKTQSSSTTEINISGVGYNNIFLVENSGVLNMRKIDINGWPNDLIPAGYNDLERTLFGVYGKSKLNLFEANINNVEVKGTQAFYAYDKSRIVIYRSNINGFAGKAFSNIFDNSSLNILRTKITDAKVNEGINVFNQSILNFQKSFISSRPLRLSDSSSGTCIQAFSGTAINVLNSDIGPCLVAFSLMGTGNFKVNQNNISGNGDAVLNESPSADFKNNWWGRSDGPKPLNLSMLPPHGNYSTDEYIDAIKNQNAIEDYPKGVIALPFSPTQFKEASPCCSSVLFIPGIQSSRLYKKGLFGSENQLWEPNRNKDVESLFLNSNGVSIDSNIYTRDIIEKTNFFGSLGSIDIYQSLTDQLSKEKIDGNISDFQTLAYDWRFLPSNILSSGIKTDSYTIMLKDKIREMAKKAGSGKVIIVAHSYGGLLAKSLMEDFEKEGEESLVESIVLVSVPEYGTPQAVPSLFYGDNEDLLGGIILSKNTAISLGKNMLSAHLLLPSNSYFTESDGVYNQKNIIAFDNWVSSKYKFSKTTIDSFSQMSDFLKNKNIVSATGINSVIFDKASSEHDLIDNFSANLSAKTFSIVAVGIPTLSGLTYVRPRCRGLFFCLPNALTTPDFTRKYSLMGDGVVIAHNLARRTGSVFTVDIGKENELKKTAPLFFREDPIAHKDVFRSSGVKDVLHAILSRVKKESEMINSFGMLSNPYVSYVSGSISKPGPILGNYGDSSILSGVPKIAEDAAGSDFVQRFNNSKVLVAEAYGPLVLKTNYKNVADLQNKSFDQLNLEKRIVNYTNYSDGNRVGVVSVVPSGVAGSGINIFGQGSGVGVVQIVTKVDNTEMIYPNISVTPATNINIDYSTTTIAIDNNSDGLTDRNIVPIQINVGTTTTATSTFAGTSSLAYNNEFFTRIKAKLQTLINGTSSSLLASSSLSNSQLSTSSIYLVNKYIDKLDVAERKYQKFGVLQSFNLLKSFYGTMESNMNIISSLINIYNKQQGFYSFNNFLSTGKKVLFLNQRQNEIREEVLVYIEIHNAFAELIQGLGEGL